FIFFFQAEDGIRYRNVTGVQTCALPISLDHSFIDKVSPLHCKYISATLFLLGLPSIISLSEYPLCFLFVIVLREMFNSSLHSLNVIFFPLYSTNTVFVLFLACSFMVAHLQFSGE